jgi:hypothetical protein
MKSVTSRYTKREAEFLRLAALQSGYFLRRHFNEFIGKECGALAQRFIERGLHQTDFKALPTRPVVYHATGSSLYAALGDPQNRNRREHETATVRRRLMALDFLLLHSSKTFLVTEQEKLSHFASSGVQQSVLPGEMFGTARRYFVDRQPICFSENGAAPGVAEFAFIDEGLRYFSRFELFLKVHRGLFHALPGTCLVFATCDKARFVRAEQLFQPKTSAALRLFLPSHTPFRFIVSVLGDHLPPKPTPKRGRNPA